MWRLLPQTAFVLIAATVFGSEANCQTTSVRTPLKGKVTIRTHAKFITPKGAVLGRPVLPRTVYANLDFTIGDPQDPDRNQFIKDTIANLGKSLPRELGSDDGSYTVTIKVSDAAGSNLITEPIVTFQWTRQRSFLFFEKTVRSVQAAGWNGSLVNQMLIQQPNQKLKVSIEASFQQNRSLDFDLLKKTATTASSGAIAKLLPLPATALPFMNAAIDFLKAFYDGSKTIKLTEEYLVTIGETPSPLITSFTFRGEQGGEIEVPIFITIGTIQSKLVSGNLTNGKFEPGQISESTFGDTELIIGGKATKLVDVLESADRREAKSARIMLDALAEGKEYGKDPARQDEDVGLRCGALFGTLGDYLSKPDVAGMFWSFLRHYATKIDKDRCVGPAGDGTRQAEILSYGLTP